MSVSRSQRKGLILGGIAAAIAIAVAGAALAARAFESDRLPPQPIAFNHRLHLERAQGIACLDCHSSATSQTYAGIPGKAICFGCHDPDPDPDDASADARKPAFDTLMAFAKDEGDIPWRRVTATREDVFFSHRRHVAVAKIDCRRCHGDMPERTSPPTHGPIVISMDECLSCHEETKASADCVSCHR
ncbi:MAG: cytochrome c3 family protein [Planctomycetes bacterium]|nr:cytochrome c3 family protein [Planctomycetota bacterium]